MPTAYSLGAASGKRIRHPPPTEQGVAAAFAAIQSGDGVVNTGFAERLLRRPRGERDLTDYRHLAEILHAARPSQVGRAGTCRNERGGG